MYSVVSFQEGDKYNVTIRLDPCFFPSYDLDRNGVFAKEELLTIFGNNEKADALFASLDAEPGKTTYTAVKDRVINERILLF